MKQKQKNEPSFINVIISLYLFIMLGFFPLYYKYQYADMGDEKYKIFLYASSICVGMVLVCLICRKIFSDTKWKQNIKKHQSKESDKENAKELTKLDTAVLIYFICTTIAFLCSSFKEKAFWGSDGWNMGFLSQFLFIASYFLLAKCWKYQKWAVRLLMVSSAIVFLVAVFHRFDLDILNIYGNLDLKYKVLFLSTMGQSSWYSSFLCTVFPVGLYLFFIGENKKVRIIAGMYSVVAMCSLVTQNTDSAFMSLFAVMMVLFYLSFENRKKEFLEVIILVLGSFCFMGICQRIFADKAIPLDTMSLFMSQSIVMCILLAAVVICYGVLCYGKYPKKRQEISLQKEDKVTDIQSIKRLPFWILVGAVIIGTIGTIIFIVLNTNGFLLDKLGYQSTNNYLLFDTQWGNGRGFAWQFAVGSFADFPFLRKLIGVGPDCFSAYIASVPQYLEQMEAFWGDLVLTNAHNEYLTKLYNIGIVGLLSYVGMLVTAIGTFLKYRTENPYLPAFALCVVSYMVHNIFCYEQVCCTPFFYILMGIGSSLIHNKIQKGTY